MGHYRTSFVMAVILTALTGIALAGIVLAGIALTGFLGTLCGRDTEGGAG